jgi:hypothetical protein
MVLARTQRSSPLSLGSAPCTKYSLKNSYAPNKHTSNFDSASDGFVTILTFQLRSITCRKTSLLCN